MVQLSKQFVVECNRCQRAISAGVKEFPFHSIVVGWLLGSKLALTQRWRMRTPYANSLG